MLKHRVIPCLLLKDDGLCKTYKFNQSKYIGDPINAIRIFNEKEVDELIVLDITASKQYREPNYGLIEQFASECFMPLCYGGGIRTMEQAEQLFSLGVEKVCLQTAAIENLTIVRQIADRYGSQSTVVSVDVKTNWLKRKKLYASSQKKMLAQPWLDFLKKAAEFGAGEVVLNSVDQDGVMQGMDIDIIRIACQALSIPVIASGGVGQLSDIKCAVDAGASAVAVGSFFVFHGPHRAVLITYPKYHELEWLLSAN